MPLVGFSSGVPPVESAFLSTGLDLAGSCVNLQIPLS